MEFKGRIVVYSITGCPHCKQAKNTLTEYQLPFTEVNLDTFPLCRDVVKQRTGRNTVPQIFFNNIHVGGNDDLQKLVKDASEFDRLMDEVKLNPPPPDAPDIPDPSTAVDTGDESDFVCEPDKYARLVAEFKASGVIKDHRSLLRSVKNAFTGQDFVNWVINHKDMGHDQAMELGQLLLSQHFGQEVSGKSDTFRDDGTYYRLVEDSETTALNGGETTQCTPRPVNDLGEDLRRLILKIYSSYLSADGKSVDYAGIGASKEFERYVALSRELVRADVQSASREEKLAFFINIYNALVIHANVTRGPPVGLWQRYKFFNSVCYIIGGHTYSLQDIENGVLRANRKGVGMFFRPFGKSDPRLQVALTSPEPLIHFALVCGAKSCPPIKTYSADDVMKQLRTAAESFLEGDDGCQLAVDKKEVLLSKIFKWYRPDFGNTDEEVLRFVHYHMDEGEKKSQLGDLLAGPKVKLNYLPYNWGLNK